MNIEQRIAVLQEMADCMENLRRTCDIISGSTYYTDGEKIAKIFAINRTIEIIAKAAEGV